MSVFDDARRRLALARVQLGSAVLDELHADECDEDGCAECDDIRARAALPSLRLGDDRSPAKDRGIE